jgi:hypothetical protein
VRDAIDSGVGATRSVSHLRRSGVFLCLPCSRAPFAKTAKSAEPQKQRQRQRAITERPWRQQWRQQLSHSWPPARRKFQRCAVRAASK